MVPAPNLKIFELQKNRKQKMMNTYLTNLMKRLWLDRGLGIGLLHCVLTFEILLDHYMNEWLEVCNHDGLSFMLESVFVRLG